MEYFSRSSVKQEAKDLIKPDKRWLYNFFAGIVPYVFVYGINIKFIINGSDGSLEGIDPSSFVGLFSGSFLFSILSLATLPILVAYAGSYQLKCIRYTDYNVGFVYENAFANYGKYFTTGFLKRLYENLWACLLIIPGIVKRYSYYFTFYIIGENPNLTANEAITLSRKMTKDHKWDLFVLDLSFIGWRILASIGLGIPYIWVLPYIETTKAMYYENYKKMALDNHIVNANEFGYVDVDDTDNSYDGSNFNTATPKNYVPSGFNQQNVDTHQTVENPQQEINNTQNIIEQQKREMQKNREILNNTEETNSIDNNSSKKNDDHVENLFEISNKFDFSDKNNKDDNSNSNGFEV